MFTDQDLDQIRERGSDLAEVNQQIQNFVEGFPFMDLQKAATVDDGIIRLSQEEVDSYLQQYQTALADKKIVKFVPASGAASRMFKALFAFMNTYSPEQRAEFEEKQAPKDAFTFIDRIEDFAFTPSLKKTFQNGDFGHVIESGHYGTVIDHLLTSAGLNYGQLPKGLLEFHSYGAATRTPVEEHLVEAANYATQQGGTAWLHFTVSPEHRSRFEAHLAEVMPKYQEEFGVKFDVTFSEQKSSTDTIAVDMENQPFRLDDGSILFRPGGHGALLENLDDLEGDIFFIKNIDNVVPDRIKEETYRYKQALGGLLLEVQAQVFTYLEKLEAGETSLKSEIEEFLKTKLYTLPPAGYADWSEEDQIAFLKSKLDRPMRICGMVKNEGEPGGGPFWTQNSDGTVSLQIVESAQIDKDNADQMALMQNATHFNPVDLVCATKDRHGKDYELLNFRDPQTGFIAYKSKDGRELKAQELPGLWNGAMANWSTIFVEVPIITFNPVKTVNDLLRDQHQG
ncbi:DUF4301 family protein [Pontibacter sp. G13]|uniref:DUF4301 family protein n=1 Tax=Pontibacter sp. G13 TaxID=3074898 RepID=UPI0028898907|nr:DUF4301 family protein [Pontibacter sp. G13]WNJ20179.1 DUF4301 family protein [Pontibacter sp. G13]